MNEVALASEAFDVMNLEGLLAQVEALRGKAASPASAAPRPDPVRLCYIEALARHLQAAPPAVQKVLQAKLAEALKALGGSVVAEPIVHTVAQPPTNATSGFLSMCPETVDGHASTPRKLRAKAQPEVAAPAAPLSLLGQLNQHIQSVSAPPESAGGGSAPRGLLSTRPQDLKSAIRFRETWARISAEAEVDEATHRAPENAGPLNAHSLVLRTLSLMRDLSPDYLRRFLSHTESLMWLDQANGPLKRPVGMGRKTLKNR